MRLLRTIPLFAVMMMAALTQSAQSAQTVTEKKTIPLKGEKTLETNLDFGAGELHLRPASDAADLFEGRFTFHPGRIEPEVNYSSDRQKGRLDLKTHSIRKLFSDRNPKNEWELAFSKKVTHTFDISLGACEATLDFSGLPIEEMEFSLGAGDCDVYFHSPNPVEMDRLKIESGASQLRIAGLGNARFKKLNFDGGVGDFKLDFSGEWSGDRYADISVGLGSVEIRFPPELGVRVYKDGALSSVDFDPDLDRVSDGVWESSNYRSAKNRLIINLSVGLGSAALRRAER